MRVLFASTRHAGHVGPLLPLARACLRAGHDVLLACPASAAGRAGLPHRAVAEPSAEDVAAVWTPTSAPGAAHVIQNLFVRLHARTALPDMLATVAEWRPDVVVRETMEFSSTLAAERYGVPQVRFGIHLASRNDSDDGYLAALATAALDELRPHAGLGPDPEGEQIRRSPLFTLSPPSFGDPSETVSRFRDSAASPAKRMPDGPLVYVSFGSETPASDLFPGVYRAAVDALAELPVRGLVTIGDRRDPAELGPVPPSIRVERWIPQAAVMPHAAAMVGHGGSGSTLMALAAGVPQVLVPLFVDGPSNSRRVAELGAGIALEGVADIAGAVREVLAEPRYRRAAQTLADEIRALPSIDEAVDEIAQRSATGHAIR